MFIGALNPCPCGYYGDPVKECTCSAAMVTRYQKRISGPLLDRSALPPRGIDTPRDLEVPRVEHATLSGDRVGEPSAATRSGRPGGGGAGAVQRSWTPVGRRRGGSRAAGYRPTPTPLHLRSGARVGPAEVRDFCAVDEAGRSLLRAAMQQLQMSARAYHRTRSVKLARTIADLAGSEGIETVHLAEAIQYRPRRQT
mgnify:CR=1 FL=1